MECPECKGKGKMLGLFPIWEANVPKEDRKPYIEMECSRCCGRGVVPEAMVEWMEDGKTLREKRTSKRMTLRKASDVLSIDASYLCNMEAGIIEPDLNIEY